MLKKIKDIIITIKIKIKVKWFFLRDRLGLVSDEEWKEVYEKMEKTLRSSYSSNDKIEEAFKKIEGFPKSETKGSHGFTITFPYFGTLEEVSVHCCFCKKETPICEARKWSEGKYKCNKCFWKSPVKETIRWND